MTIRPPPPAVSAMVPSRLGQWVPRTATLATSRRCRQRRNRRRFRTFERQRGQQNLGAQLGANSYRCQATPGHSQPSSVQLDGSVSDAKQHDAMAPPVPSKPGRRGGHTARLSGRTAPCRRPGCRVRAAHPDSVPWLDLGTRVATVAPASPARAGDLARKQGSSRSARKYTWRVPVMNSVRTASRLPRSLPMGPDGRMTSPVSNWLPTGQRLPCGSRRAASAVLLSGASSSW